MGHWGDLARKGILSPQFEHSMYDDVMRSAETCLLRAAAQSAHRRSMRRSSRAAPSWGDRLGS